MAPQRKVTAPYYQQHQKKLDKHLKDLKRQVQQLGLGLEGGDPNLAFFNEICEGVTRHPMREYQLDALYTLHHIYEYTNGAMHSPKNLNLKQYDHVRPLLEEVDKETKQKSPFIGFEMATGSGKTMLMGASVYYLNKIHRIRHFLIITPSSTEIYKKTIHNFTVGNPQTVWNDEVPLRFNLVTGDNYKDYGTLMDGDEDAWVFVFNIDKFGANATNTKKQWESSVWKDKAGNTISLLDFLTQEDLVIITDEAHHAQSRKAAQIIRDFKPKAVLEFTATAIETHRSDAKKNQTIVYKYDVRRFLEEKYGKLVRILALHPAKKSKGKPTELSDVERLKLLTFFLVHMVKKKALPQDPDCRGLKSLGFVKVKNDIKYAEKVEDYIRSELANDTENLKVILEKAKGQDLEITNLILDLYQKDFQGELVRLQEVIAQIALRSILLHSKAEPLVKRQFDTIQTNDVEIVIYINMLDEGIDLPNIYSMVVINDNPTEFKTAVKQIVGRGVRLNKEQRLYDEEGENILLTQTEKLHVVCDEDAAFQEVIESIQQDFGLGKDSKLFAFERGDELHIDNMPKADRLKGVFLPKVRVSFKRREGMSILNLIKDHKTIVDEFIRYNCFTKEETGEDSHYLKGYKPNTFFTEADLFQDFKNFVTIAKQEQWHTTTLNMQDRDVKAIYGRVVSKLNAIPDVPETYQAFKCYQEQINDLELQYFWMDEVDHTLARNRFIDTFVFFYIHYIEDKYFIIDRRTLDNENDYWNLKQAFGVRKIAVREDDINNQARNEKDVKKVRDLVKQGYHFYGYPQSIYDYDNFDTFPEKQLADYLNHVLTNDPTPKGNHPFWLRNQREVFFEYGNHKYYPDFLMFLDKVIYVLEMKGEHIVHQKKAELLIFSLKDAPGLKGKMPEGYVGVVILSNVVAHFKDEQDYSDFPEFLKSARDAWERFEKVKDEIKPETEVVAEDRYRIWLPVYNSLDKAYRAMHKGEDTIPDGWKEVTERKEGYPKSAFVVLIRTEDLAPTYGTNDWIILDADLPDVKALVGRIVLAHHKDIEDEAYGKRGHTIRRFTVEEQNVLGSLFPEKKVILAGETEDVERFELDSQCEVIAVELLS